MEADAGGDVGDGAGGGGEEFAGVVEADFGEVFAEAHAGALMEEAAEVFAADVAGLGDLAEEEGGGVAFVDEIAGFADDGGEGGVFGQGGFGGEFLNAAEGIAEGEGEPAVEGLRLFGGEGGAAEESGLPVAPGVGTATAGDADPGGFAFFEAVVGIAVAGEDEGPEFDAVEEDGAAELSEAGAAGDGMGGGLEQDGLAAEGAGASGEFGLAEALAEGDGTAAGAGEQHVAEGIEEGDIETGEQMQVFEVPAEEGGACQAGAEGFLQGFGHGSGLRNDPQGLGAAVVKVPAEADGEDDLAVEGMFEPGEPEVGVALPGAGEEEAGDEGEQGGGGVEHEEMRPAEEEAVGEKERPALAEKAGVALQKKYAEEVGLRGDREQGVEEYHQGPEGEIFAGEAEEEVGGEGEGEGGEGQGGGGGAEEDAGEGAGIAFGGGRKAVADLRVAEAEDEGNEEEADEDGEENEASLKLQPEKSEGDEAEEEEAFDCEKAGAHQGNFGALRGKSIRAGG